MLKCSEPKIEPCGTPNSIFDLALKQLLILVRCVLRFRYEFKADDETPYHKALQLEVCDQCNLKLSKGQHH